MPTGSEELQNHDEKTWADMMIYDQVFPHTGYIFCSSQSWAQSYMPIYFIFCMFPIFSTRWAIFPLDFHPHVSLLCFTAVTCMDLLSLFTPSFLGGPTESDKISLFIFSFWHARLCFFCGVFTSRLLDATVNSVVLLTMLYCGVIPYTIKCSQYKNQKHISTLSQPLSQEHLYTCSPYQLIMLKGFDAENHRASVHVHIKHFEYVH